MYIDFLYLTAAESQEYLLLNLNVQVPRNGNSQFKKM